MQTRYNALAHFVQDIPFHPIGGICHLSGLELAPKVVRVQTMLTLELLQVLIHARQVGLVARDLMVNHFAQGSIQECVLKSCRIQLLELVELLKRNRDSDKTPFVQARSEL